MTFLAEVGFEVADVSYMATPQIFPSDEIDDKSF